MPRIVRTLVLVAAALIASPAAVAADATISPKSSNKSSSKTGEVSNARSNDPADILARYAELGPQLTDNAFGRPLYVESRESRNAAAGEVYAVVDHPFARVQDALRSADSWCDIVILHVNVKMCRAESAAKAETLHMNVGRKFEQPLGDTHPLDFDYRVAADSPRYLAVELAAPNGPAGTSDYEIALEAVPLANNRTFLHLEYSYGFGNAARLATTAYLASLGRGKVGFTIVGDERDADPEYVGGMRGILERNVMRYYLAIDAYLATLSRPPAQRFQARLDYWADAAASYPRQLLDFERDEYFAMKKEEYRRQQQ